MKIFVDRPRASEPPIFGGFLFALWPVVLRSAGRNPLLQDTEKRSFSDVSTVYDEG